MHFGPEGAPGGDWGWEGRTFSYSSACSRETFGQPRNTKSQPMHSYYSRHIEHNIDLEYPIRTIIALPTYIHIEHNTYVSAIALVEVIRRATALDVKTHLLVDVLLPFLVLYCYKLHFYFFCSFQLKWLRPQIMHIPHTSPQGQRPPYPPLCITLHTDLGPRPRRRISRW